MKLLNDRELIQPAFLDTNKIQIAVATSDFCNALCESCIWPYMKSKGRVMSLEEFELILDKFAGFQFIEFAFNVINEPFVDRGICQKISKLAERQIYIDNLFFSSNWLLPKAEKIDEFVLAIEACVECPTIQSISINATVSGIDRTSYDRLQGGSLLTNTLNKYKPLDFQKVSHNICEFVSKLSLLKLHKPVVFRIKAYGDLFDEQAMKLFWHETLLNYGISRKFIHKHVEIVLNHEYISFARFSDRNPTISGAPTRQCKSLFLSDKLTIGSGGELGLCCQDGLRSIVIGNLLEEDLTEIVFSPEYQNHLRIVTGLSIPPQDHACSNCEFYLIPA